MCNSPSKKNGRDYHVKKKKSNIKKKMFVEHVRVNEQAVAGYFSLSRSTNNQPQNSNMGDRARMKDHNTTGG